MAPQFYVIFEHASGYGLFNVQEFEEISMLLPQVEESVSNLKRFNQLVKLTSFTPFKTTVDALQNMNSISEGIMPESLQLFLEYNLPKKGTTTLGVHDPKLAAAISDTLQVSCLCTGPVPEILRGIRLHFTQLVKGFTTRADGVAQLGLGHSYSRAKVKFNVNRVDNMIIQSIALLDQMDKDINTFSMRIREWYSYHFPELYKIVPENFLYAKLASYIGNRKRLSEEHVPELEEIVMDEAKANSILKASRSSMGMDIADIDLSNIETFAKKIIGLSEYRTNLVTYLRKKMDSIAPNLATLIGDSVGARLISRAGSLTNLAKYPASTVQVLGAEKALFRALKVRGKTPKYGLLYHSTFIAKAEGKNKGRISRFLANKCSIASRIDCFSEIPTSIYGESMKQQVEDRLKFYTTGDIPKKNIDVMAEAYQMAQMVQNDKAVNGLDKSEKSKKKKKRKLDETAAEDITDVNGRLDQSGFAEADLEEEPKKKKKKKKSKSEKMTDEMEASTSRIEDDEEVQNEDTAELPKKKNKKKKNKGNQEN